MNQIPIKIFYAYSNHNGEDEFDDALTDKLRSIGYQFEDVDDQNNIYLLDNIHTAIKNCDIVIGNITPDNRQIDTDEKMHLCNNSNVIYEYGYAIAQNKRFISILNKKKNIGYELPAILRTLQYTDYSEDSEGAIESVCEKIQVYINEEKERIYFNYIKKEYSNVSMDLIFKIEKLLEMIHNAPTLLSSNILIHGFADNVEKYKISIEPSTNNDEKNMISDYWTRIRMYNASKMKTNKYDDNDLLDRKQKKYEEYCRDIRSNIHNPYISNMLYYVFKDC
jgi:nucleoside 2-deoxyribosyltransferase